MKLITVNMEGVLHIERIIALIKREQPDCICLQEMPTVFIYNLILLGYYPTFSPMFRDAHRTSTNEALGICIATRTPHDATIHNYGGTQTGIPIYERRPDDSAKSFQLITATFSDDTNNTYTIATTHLMVTATGVSSEPQQAAVDRLLEYLSSYPPHIFCGDFNMPRGYNTNYERFLEQYGDAVPTHYASSLDRNLHRSGHSMELGAPIFDIYMVDYIFTQPPYVASDVRLEFGVSDHAAVIATIAVQSKS